MKRFKFPIYLGAVWLGFAPMGWSQAIHDPSSEPATVLLTLSKVEDLVLKQNPHVQGALDREKAAAQRASQTLSPNDPTLMWDRSGQNNSPFNLGNSNQQMLMLEEQIKFPGKSLVAAGVDDAETRERAALTDNVRRTVLYQARQAFWEFYFRGKVDQILMESEGKWKAFSGALKTKELTGQWLSVKAIRAQMEIAKASNDRITTAKALEVSTANLNHVLNLGHHTQYVLQEPVIFPPLEETLESFLDRAGSQNPELTAAKREIEKNKSLQASADMDHLPDFMVRAYGVQNAGDPGFQSFGLRLGMTLPIFFATKQDKAAQEASLETAASQAELAGKQNEVAHMVEEAYVNVESAWRLLNLYEKGGLKNQVERAWAASQAAYHNDEMSLSELVENYNSYLGILTDYYRAQADYGEALARLQYETGELNIQEAKNEIK